MRRRDFITIMAGTVTWPLTAAAQQSSQPRQAAADVSFAGKNITMVVGFEAGSGPDIYGRTVGRHLVRYLPGQPGLIVLNQLGAGGVVAMNSWVNKAEPNGLSVALGTLSQTDPDALMRTKSAVVRADQELTGFKVRMDLDPARLKADEPHVRL